jgi:hypothetical protein
VSCFAHAKKCDCDECTSTETITVEIPISVHKAMLSYEKFTIKRGRHQTMSEIVTTLLRSALVAHNDTGHLDTVV